MSLAPLQWDENNGRFEMIGTDYAKLMAEEILAQAKTLALCKKSLEEISGLISRKNGITKKNLIDTIEWIVENTLIGVDVWTSDPDLADESCTERTIPRPEHPGDYIV